MPRRLRRRLKASAQADPARAGVGSQPETRTAEAVKQRVDAIGSERFRGLITHAGHVYAATNLEERQRAADQESGGLLSTAEMLREQGVEVLELSVGSTPTAGLVLTLPSRLGEGRGGGITEMRPGTYIYGDANQV